jgi:hypothetical protein
MTGLLPLMVSIGILAGVATWIFLSAGVILIWAAFVAWACFFHSGGDEAALKSTIVCNIFGVICAWIAAIVILAIPLAETLTLPLWAAIVVAVTVAAYTIAANITLLSSIPATTYGYACTFAFLLQTPDKLSIDMLSSASLNNALIVVIVSMVIGALFGFATGKFATVLTSVRP